MYAAAHSHDFIKNLPVADVTFSSGTWRLHDNFHFHL